MKDVEAHQEVLKGMWDNTMRIFWISYSKFKDPNEPFLGMDVPMPEDFLEAVLSKELSIGAKPYAMMIIVARELGLAMAQLEQEKSKFH